MQTFTLTSEQYSALVALARRGVAGSDGQRALEEFLSTIEKANGVVRSSMWIQWQEADAPVPTTQFPEKWPPEMRYFLEFISRPIARTDVERVLAVKARKPVNVLVTTDPGALVGWTTIEAYFR